jgi:hypothetical protein
MPGSEHEVIRRKTTDQKKKTATIAGRAGELLTRIGAEKVKKKQQSVQST